jgi:hypothetical protein
MRTTALLRHRENGSMVSLHLNFEIRKFEKAIVTEGHLNSYSIIKYFTVLLLIVTYLLKI